MKVKHANSSTAHPTRRATGGCGSRGRDAIPLPAASPARPVPRCQALSASWRGFHPAPLAPRPPNRSGAAAATAAAAAAAPTAAAAASRTAASRAWPARRYRRPAAARRTCRSAAAAAVWRQRRAACGRHRLKVSIAAACRVKKALAPWRHMRKHVLHKMNRHEAGDSSEYGFGRQDATLLTRWSQSLQDVNATRSQTSQ